MALYTSTQSGNWNDPNTWGGGGWPGGTDGAIDTFLISEGHVVTLNMPAFIGSAQVNGGTVNGTLLVATRFNAANDFYSGNWIVNGLITFKNDSYGTYELRICRNSTMTIKSGGKIEAISKDFNVKAYHRLNFDQEAVSNTTNLIVEAGGEVEFEGWEKTQKTHLTSTMNSGTKTMIVADDGNWEVGDDIALIKGPLTTYKKLASKNSDLSWELNSTVTTEYLENTMIYNTSKSVTFGNLANQTRAARIDIAPGATAKIKNVYLYGGCLNQIKEIGEYDTITMYGAYVNIYTNFTPGITLKNIFIYCWGINGDAISIASDLFYLENCDIVNAATDIRNQGLVVYCNDGKMKNVWVDAIGGCLLSRIGNLDWTGGGICSANSTISSLITSFSGNIKLSDINFGYTEKGLSFPNNIDLSPNTGVWLLDNCKFSATTMEIETPNSGLYGVVSLNHNQISGERLEMQKYGVLTTNSIESRSGKCYKIDPSHTLFPFILRIYFPILSGKTPQLKFWAKGAGTLGSLEVEMGINNAGLKGILASSGSLDENRRFVVSEDYQQFTINFDGVSDKSGEVEVRILICDNTSGVFYLDDITMSGNL